MQNMPQNLPDRQAEVYMTALTNEKYVPGVKALKKSLEKVHSKHGLVILVPESKEKVLRAVLEKNKIIDSYCFLCVKEDLVVEYPEDVHFEQHYWSNTFFKLCAADCTEFKKIILLDSDMLIRHNIDHLFNKPHYSAAVAGQCANPEWVKLGSGLMVIEPSQAFFKKLTDSIRPAMYRRFHEGNNIGDQDVFQEAFMDWENHPELLLPERYNCFFGLVRQVAEKEQIKLRDISVIHFIGKEKPWSHGCFTLRNVRRCLSFVKHRKFFELKVFVEYLLLSAI